MTKGMVCSRCSNTCRVNLQCVQQVYKNLKPATSQHSCHVKMLYGFLYDCSRPKIPQQVEIVEFGLGLWRT